MPHALQHMADIEPDQHHTTAGRQQIRRAKTDVLRQRQQQQIKERQRHTHQRVLHRVHRQALEHFEQEETGERQHDEQQRIFDCTVALQVLIHRIDETHAKAAGVEGLAIIAAHAAAHGVLQVGGEERGLPVSAEPGVIDFTFGRQEVADKTWMRPIGGEAHAAALAHRQHLQRAGALQAQIKAERQFRGFAGVERWQRHPYPLAEPADLRTGNKVQALAVEFQFQGVFDAANVADADRKKRCIELVVDEVFLDAQLRRQGEMPVDAVIGVEQPRLVNAPGAQFGLHLTIELEAFRQEVQTPALFARLVIPLIGLVVDLPVVHHFAIRHHHHRPAQLLAVTGAAGDVFKHAVTQLLTIIDDAVNHQQRHQQQQDQQANGPEFYGQTSVHKDAPLLEWDRV